MKKVFIRFFGLLSLIMLCIGVCSCSSNSKSTNEDLENNQEAINSIVELAIEESDIRLDDYLDVDYFANLQYSTEALVGSIQKLSMSYENDEVSSIDMLQYETLATSITEIMDDLPEEEYSMLEKLAKEDNEISEFLELIESGFEVDETKEVKTSIKTAVSNVTKLSAGILEIGGILAAQKVCQAAIIAIKGAFNSMIAALKAFFVPNVVKGIIITAAILVIATVVIINWNKIKPVFTRIANVFVDNAKKFASAVANVFNSIQQRAVSATTYNSFDDVVNKDSTIYNKLRNSGKTMNQLKEVLAMFLSLSGTYELIKFYNSNNKVLCIGRDMRETYNNNDISGYQNYAKKYNYWSFWSAKYDLLKAQYGTLVDLANEVLVLYCCSADWDFILVTNPYHYMVEHRSTTYGGDSYALEIATIRGWNYNRFTNSNVTWQTIPNPGYSKASFYALSAYRVSR